MTTVELNYIGAISLMGRLSCNVRDEDDRELIQRAMSDCAAAFPGKFEVVRAGGGWSLEPIFNQG